MNKKEKMLIGFITGFILAGRRKSKSQLERVPDVNEMRDELRDEMKTEMKKLSKTNKKSK